MEAIKLEDYEIDVLIQGFPGRMVCHGGLGWSTIALIRGRGHVALVDVGSFNMRKGLIEQLAKRGLEPDDVTDVRGPSQREAPGPWSRKVRTVSLPSHAPNPYEVPRCQETDAP